MSRLRFLKSVLGGSACAMLLVNGAFAEKFNIPAGDLSVALDAYTMQTGLSLMVSSQAVRGLHTKGAKGELSAGAALSQILSGTGFVERHEASGVAIVRGMQKSELTVPTTRLAEIAPRASAAAGIESVVVTSSKIKGDIQIVPIAITALSQEQLTSRQIAGGPDLVKEVPNLTFSKTNFTGYNIQIRGIGTQAISVTTDPAVAVAFNDTPFIRNHFFEQEFYDVSQVEVLRGPQGTLYGRNATAGVVNLVSAKPTDQFEAMLSADVGNYNNRRVEGMINIPIVDDRLDLRVAGEWTKRDGYSFNSLTNAPIDGRDLWSSRITIGWKPSADFQADLVWEHFQENDDRLRSSKQLCKTDPGRGALYTSQGCLPESLYAPASFQVPNGFSLGYYTPLAQIGVPVDQNLDPYAATVQSRNLRVIESALNPIYRAKNDVVELNADYSITPALTLTSQTGFGHDFLWATEDYNRFNTAPGVFLYNQSDPTHRISPEGVFCDPQLGCSDRLVAEDLSSEHAWQLSQEFRMASSFIGPINFSIGANYLHYETEENYYVFINSLTLWAAGPPLQFDPWVAGVSDNHQCLKSAGNGYAYSDPRLGSRALQTCKAIDPNPLTSLDNEGHNYFLSQNPYVLNSYAAFSEAYYTIAQNLKLTGGLRWTRDEKHFTEIPSELVTAGWGYPSTGVVNQNWGEFTGRFAANWTPATDFTDQTLVYGSYAHGYKAGGANPPGAVLLEKAALQPIHPLIFKPEFIDAFELGTKNTLLDGAMTLNGNIFYYDYKAYQISEIVDRTSINRNFDATVKGAELETTWEPAVGLKFSFAGGYEDTAIAKGSKAVDLIDRTDKVHHPDWMVLKPFPTMASNCVFPIDIFAQLSGGTLGQVGFACGTAYGTHEDPGTGLPYVPNPTVGSGDGPYGDPPPGYPGFDPATAPNNGAGFDKDLSNNELPSAPHFTASLTAEYTVPVSEDWAATLHSDFYWQSQSWARVFNDRPYDKIRGYSNVNVALILTSADGWQVLGYLKNIFDSTAITGDFLNSDDTGLTTNVFLTDPRLFGVRVTKNF